MMVKDVGVYYVGLMLRYLLVFMIVVRQGFLVSSVVEIIVCALFGWLSIMDVCVLIFVDVGIDCVLILDGVFSIIEVNDIG